jgi:hypothetical protein
VLAADRRKCLLEVVRPPHWYGLQLHPYRARCDMPEPQRILGGWIAGMPKEANAGDSGNQFFEQLKLLPGDFGSGDGQSCDVTPRPCEAGDNAGGYWISITRHDDRYRLSRLLCSERILVGWDDDHVDSETDEFGR